MDNNTIVRHVYQPFRLGIVVIVVVDVDQNPGLLTLPQQPHLHASTCKEINGKVTTCIKIGYRLNFLEIVGAHCTAIGPCIHVHVILIETYQCSACEG